MRLGIYPAGIHPIDIYPSKAHKMKDRRNRAWIIIQLADSSIAYEAARIVDDWKRSRRAAQNIISAIRLYAALLAGDTSVLYELFPGLGFNFGSSRPAPRRAIGTQEVQITPISAESEADDLIDVLGNMEF